MGLYLGNTLIAPIISDDSLPNSLIWMGQKAEVVESNFASKSITLAETSFPTWTPTTSATSIYATTTTKNFTADLEHYEYIIEWLWDVRVSYLAGATLKACPISQFGTMYQIVHRRAYGETSFAADLADYNYCTLLYQGSNYIIYYKSNGSRAWTTAPSYGLYETFNVATLGSTTALNTTFNPKTPTFYARCSTTYFATGMAKSVDQEATTLKYTGNVYRVKVNTNIMKPMFMKASHLYANPL